MKYYSALVNVAAFASVALAIVPPRQPHQPLGNGNLLLTYNNTVVRGEFGTGLRSVEWLATGQDGQFITFAGNALVLNDIVTGANETFVAASKIPEGMVEYWIRPDLKKVLFSTNYTGQYRYSYFADYSVLDVESGVITPVVADQAGDIQYAALSPVGDVVAFVRGNNLYLNKNGTIIQITSDGGPDKFNGVPDWVYEEEIFSDRSTLWFSPDGQFIAFLSFDEAGVGTFTVPYYMNGQDVAPSYPRELKLRYPKVGTTNPTVTFSLLNVETEQTTAVAVDAFPADDLIIGDVSWVTSGHKNLLYRAFNRVQDHEKLVVVEVDSVVSKTVRERDGTDGWLDNNRVISYVGPTPGSCNVSYYLDLSDESGWNHIYIFPVQGGEGKALTSGNWEVTAILKIDTGRQLIYYQSTEGHSTERHLYSVSYVTGEKKKLVDDSIPAYWSASFSAAGSYYILNYQGPDVPYQELYSINSSEPLKVITSNEATWNKIQQYKLPNITYFELEHPEGFSLNVMQRLPANFDPSKKYPALFTPYGGPGAQEVQKRFQSLGWRAYISSDVELEYITYTVDNRGTGLKGRAFRSTVASQLGLLEAEDQIWAAKELVAEFPFIDAAKVGMWGWSYGGYLTAKVLEANSGVFSTGLITAPVSDWRFYDSMYTERYMKTYQMNPAGYDKTAVRNAEGFKNAAGGFTIMHGLGDDNVHYQNTAALVDLLIGAGVPPSKMSWLAFTDSDHGISYNGASVYLYKFLTQALYREKEREPETLTHQWTKKSEPRLKAKFHYR